MKRRTLSSAVLVVSVAFISFLAAAQTTYHLHKENSSTSGLFQLKTAGPDGTSTGVQSINLKNKAAGEYLVKAFDTQAGVPNASGTIAANSTISVTLWMKKTANVGMLFPRAKLFLNSPTGAQLCTATGTTALTTTLTSYTLTCTTGADVSINTSSRYYLWVGMNLTGTAGSNFNAELDVEGTLNGNFDSRIVVPAIVPPPPPPTITSITPAVARVGASVTISGTNFGSSQGIVTFPAFDVGAPRWFVTSWSNTTIVAMVGEGSGAGSVNVITAAGMSNSVPFEIDISPLIDNISPASGPVGTTVTINGSYFTYCPGLCEPPEPPDPPPPTVTFNGVPAPPLGYNNAVITVAVPSGATTGNVVVTNPYTSQSNTNSVLFTVIQPPTISSLSPTSGGIGTPVTITGTNFGATQGSSTVSFNGTAATPQSPSNWTNTSIIVPVPTGATTGNVTVTTAGGTSNGVTFTVQSGPPTITTLEPNKGGGGTIVAITGTNFGPNQGTSTVNFGGNQLTPKSWSNTAVEIQVPDGLEPGPTSVAVTVGTVASNSATFTVTEPLLVTPSSANMVVGGSQALQVLDGDGHVVEGVTWSVRDEDLAEVIEPLEETDPFRVHAKMVGQTTVRAVLNDRSGKMDVQILAGALSPGTVLWSVPTLSPFGVGVNGIVQSVVSDENTPDIYIEERGSNFVSVIRAFTAAGQQKWIWPPVGSDRIAALLAADNDGGLLALATDSNDDPVLSRVNQSGIEMWQHPLVDFSANYAVAGDGTIYFVQKPSGQQSYVLAIDGETGAIKFTVPIPQSQLGNINWDFNPNPLSTSGPFLCYPGKSPGGLPAGVGSTNSVNGRLSVGVDDTLFLPIVVSTTIFDGQPCNPSEDPDNPPNPLPINTENATLTYSATLQVMKIQSDGGYTISSLDAFSYGGPNWNTPVRKFQATGRATPVGEGGFLYPVVNSMRSAFNGGGTTPNQALIYREDGTVYPDPGGLGGTADDRILVGDNNTAFVAVNQAVNGIFAQVVAFDIFTGAPSWSYVSSQNVARLNTITENDEVIVEEGNFAGTNYLSKLNASGGSPLFEGNPNLDFSTYADGDFWYSSSLGLLSKVATAPFVTAQEYSFLGGNKQKQIGPPKGVMFEEVSECSGLDISKNAEKKRWLMVPHQGTNTVRVSAKKNWQNLSFISSDPSKVTVSPSQATGPTSELTVTGHVADNSSFISAVATNNPQKRRGRLRISVRLPKARTVGIWSITDALGGLSPDPRPSASALQAELNRIFPKQTNVTFTVQEEGAFAFNYDVNHDLKLHRATEMTVQGPKGCWVCTDNTELKPLHDDLITKPQFQPLYNNNSFFFLYYFNNFDDRTIGGFAIAGDRSRPAVVRTHFPDFSGTHKPGYLENLSAHELAHVLGRMGHNDKGTDYLMNYINEDETPCRLVKEDWDMFF